MFIDCRILNTWRWRHNRPHDFIAFSRVAKTLVIDDIPIMILNFMLQTLQWIFMPRLAPSPPELSIGWVNFNCKWLIRFMSIFQEDDARLCSECIMFCYLSEQLRKHRRSGALWDHPFDNEQALLVHQHYNCHGVNSSSIAIHRLKNQMVFISILVIGKTIEYWKNTCWNSLKLNGHTFMSRSWHFTSSGGLFIHLVVAPFFFTNAHLYGRILVFFFMTTFFYLVTIYAISSPRYFFQTN